MISAWEQGHTIRIPYMMPVSLVESGNRKVLVPTAFTGDVGISALTEYIPTSGGRGRKLSPCGLIPLASPDHHNPVMRNESITSYVLPRCYG